MAKKKKSNRGVGRRLKTPKVDVERASSLEEGSARRRAFLRAWRSLCGVLVGDSLGQTFFGPPLLALQRIEAREVREGPWRYTDDTQMAVSILDILDQRGEIEQDHLAYAFARRFDERRGYGGGAWELLRSLRQGRDWRKEAGEMFGGQGSYGNGAAMRVAPLGAFFAEDALERVVSEATKSAEVTHQHPEGIAGGIAVAVAAALASQVQSFSREGGALRLVIVHGDQEQTLSPADVLALVLSFVPPSLVRDGLERALGFDAAVEPARVAAQLGAGQLVSAQDTVPFCLWSAFFHLDSYEEAFWNTVVGLGDRDTTCAIVGGIVASCPLCPPPAAWLSSCEPFSWDALLLS